MIRSALPLSALLKVFAETTRLRLLALVEREELSVGELSRALGMAQSRVSNHLRVLREAGLFSERHVGTSIFLRLLPQESADPGAARLWQTLRAEVMGLPEHRADLVRLDAVISDRRADDFFERIAGSWDKIAGSFETGAARHRVAAHLLPRETVVADLGCGQGYFAEVFLGSCDRIVGIDGSLAMLEQAETRLSRGGTRTRVQLLRGELERLPLADGALDAAVAGMVLHHLPSLDRPLSEVARVLRPSGTVVVVELMPHREEWMRERLGDLYLGLDGSDVVAALRRTGFEDVMLDPVEDRYRPVAPDGKEIALDLYIARGRKPRA